MPASVANGHLHEALPYANDGDPLLRAQRDSLHDLQTQRSAPTEAGAGVESLQETERHAEQQKDDAEGGEKTKHRRSAVPAGSRQDAGDAHSEVLAQHHDLSLGETAVTHEDVHRLSGEAIKLDHRAAAEVQNLLNLHRRASELDRDRQRQPV